MNTTHMADDKLLYKEETYAIIGAAMEVYNHLGKGFLEAIYQEAFALEMAARGISFREQEMVPIYYKDRKLGHTYKPDYLVYGKIIVEIKAITTTTPVEEAQLINYLKATHLRLGLLINFGHPGRLQWIRRVL